jgi:hypothetical protein
VLFRRQGDLVVGGGVGVEASTSARLKAESQARRRTLGVREVLGGMGRCFLCLNETDQLLPIALEKR